LFFLDLLHLLWSELRTKGRAATASNKVAGLSVFKIYISLAFPSAGRGGEGRKGMEMQISAGEKVLSSFLLLPGRTAWDWSQIQRPFVAFQLAGALLRMEPVAVTGFHEHLPHHGSWLRLVLPPSLCLSPLSGRPWWRGEKKESGGAGGWFRAAAGGVRASFADPSKRRSVLPPLPLAEGAAPRLGGFFPEDSSTSKMGGSWASAR